MLTSWALVCDVWYLPPEKQRVSVTNISRAAALPSLLFVMTRAHFVTG